MGHFHNAHMVVFHTKLGEFGISFPLRLSYTALSKPMKENISGYWCNPCSLKRKQGPAFTAKVLVLLSSFLFRERNLRSR